MRFFSTLLASVLGSLIALGLVFFIGLLFILALAASAGTQPSVRSGSVLVLDLSGTLPEQVSEDPFAQAFGGEPAYDLYDVKQALAKAAVDDRIEAVWLQPREILAEWGTLQEVRKALETFKESGKPLYASGDESYMGEQDYFLASVADSVFAGPQSFFEFNGFYLGGLFFNQLLAKLDIEPQIVRAGTFKAAVEPFTRDDFSPENQEQLTALLNAQNDVFLEAVAERRGRMPDALQHLIETDAVITAEGAREAGLIDGIYYEDQVEDVIKERLGVDMDDDLQTIRLRSYVRVPASEAGLRTGRDGEIAVVYAVGAIMSGESSMGTVGSETFNEAMRDVRENDRIQAVVLRINSPGGSATASEAMWREIKQTAEQKPVVVSMGDVAASGGYWIATAGETIVANPLTITGSIGVFSLFFDLGDFLDNKLGITTDFVTTSPYADMFSGLRPLSERERALLQRSTDDTYRTFLEKVADARGLDVVQVDSFGQGRVWIGTQARDLGLVDELGDLDTALDIAAEKAGLEAGSYRVRHLPEPRTFIEELNDALSVRAGAFWQRLTTSPTEQALLRHARTLDALLQAHGTVQARMPFDLIRR